MFKEFQERNGKRKAPKVLDKIIRTVVGLGLIVVAAVGELSGKLENEWIMFALVLLGAAMISKTLVFDFIGAIKDSVLNRR